MFSCKQVLGRQIYLFLNKSIMFNLYLINASYNGNIASVPLQFWLIITVGRASYILHLNRNYV